MNQTGQIKAKLARQGIRGLALDIDETLAWTIGYWVEKMQELFGNPENLSVHELIQKYRYAQNVPYWQTPEALAWMEEHRNSSEIQEQLPIIGGADSTVRAIHKQVPIVAYVTTRPTVAADGTRRWLQKHGFPSADIIARPSEVPVAEGNTWKARVLEELYPEVVGIIDDNPHLADSLSESYEGTVFLYGSTSHSKANVVVCESWNDVQTKILKLTSR